MANTKEQTHIEKSLRNIYGDRVVKMAIRIAKEGKFTDSLYYICWFIREWEIACRRLRKGGVHHE